MQFTCVHAVSVQILGHGFHETSPHQMGQRLEDFGQEPVHCRWWQEGKHKVITQRDKADSFPSDGSLSSATIQGQNSDNLTLIQSEKKEASRRVLKYMGADPLPNGDPYLKNILCLELLAKHSRKPSHLRWHFKMKHTEIEDAFPQCFQWYFTCTRHNPSAFQIFFQPNVNILTLLRFLTWLEKVGKPPGREARAPDCTKTSWAITRYTNGHKLNTCLCQQIPLEKCMKNIGDNLKGEMCKRFTQHGGWLCTLGWWFHNMVQSVAFARFHICKWHT